MDLGDELLERRIGQTVGGRFTLTRLLGQGGMGAVYAATNPEGGVAAVKLLHPEMGRRSDVRERFLREASVMTRIAHPGMVTIYEQGCDGETAYLAMELLEGEVLTERVRRLGRLPPSEVLHLLEQLLDVLVVAHGIGVIHRDIKPENLFWTRQGRLKVLDFGLARLMYDAPGRHRTRTGTTLGTLPYMAPEQALGRRDEIDARTDLFAVGATAFRLLSGRRIHEAPTEADLLMLMASAPAPKLLDRAPDVPAALALIVDRALAFAKQGRYPDAATMQADVRAVLAGRAPPYATTEQRRDDFATQVDLASPLSRSQSTDSSAKVALQTHSQRLAATVAMPVSSSARVDAPHPTIDATRPEPSPYLPMPSCPSSAHAQRSGGPLAPTISSPAVRAPMPLPAPVAPSPLSATALASQRNKTLIVGLLLSFVLVVVTTLVTLLLVG